MPRVRLAVAVGLLMGVCVPRGRRKISRISDQVRQAVLPEAHHQGEQTLKVQGGSDVPLKHEQTFYFKWTPISTDKDKTVAKQAIEGVQFKIDIAGQTIEYDSTNPTPSAPPAIRG